MECVYKKVFIRIGSSRYELAATLTTICPDDELNGLTVSLVPETMILPIGAKIPFCMLYSTAPTTLFISLLSPLATFVSQF